MSLEPCEDASPAYVAVTHAHSPVKPAVAPEEVCFPASLSPSVI